MYSMETFLYKNLNLAGRNQDENKVISLGSYARVLTYILKHSIFYRDQRYISNQKDQIHRNHRSVSEIPLR